jgi:hypothetical protein
VPVPSCPQILKHEGGGSRVLILSLIIEGFPSPQWV